MSIRKVSFAIGEYYHIYNRGVDKRIIFSDESDLDRFFQSIEEFNALDPIGSIYENSFTKDPQLGGEAAKLTTKLTKKDDDKLVDFVAYCANPNHYHFLMTPLVEKGIEKFMQRLGGYTWYFNNKYKRSGALFQGAFKAEHIDSNEYLLHASVYVNLNDRVHKLHPLGGEAAKWVKSRSSWGEYMGEMMEEVGGFCNKHIVLGQFKDIKEYQKFAESSLEDILRRKADIKDAEEFLPE